MLTIDNKMPQHYPQSFGGVLDGIFTATFRTLDTNPMANAVGIDLFSMVGPRAYYDTKKRGEWAGAETFFREFTGTLIVCLSASYLAKGISKVANKLYKPDIKINTNSWFSNDSIAYLEASWNKTKQAKSYVSNILENMSGMAGKKRKFFKDIDWNNIDWIDEAKWSKFNWDNKNYNNIHARLKDKNSIISAMTDLIDNKNLSGADRKKLQGILELRITNALGADKVTVESGERKLSSSLHNLIRDSVDLGRDVFTNSKINAKAAINKIVKINKIKSIGALVIASTLGLTNQYINRKITEKRTGIKGFVGDVDYKNRVNEKKSNKDTSAAFWFKKILASLGMAAMAITVMKIKSPADFLKKLEFTGPVTSGNAIKTVYAATLIGRFLASDNNDELRESVTRDYFGFLNWLVLGGFAAKGVANILDPKGEKLFNISKEGKGVAHWLNDISLKSHNEIAARGTKFAKENMWKLNVAHASGIAYSITVLGYLLLLVNDIVTRHRQKDKLGQADTTSSYIQMQKVSFENFCAKVASQKKCG